jgi:tetratricopeptide (TPR) repeat protein
MICEDFSSKLFSEAEKKYQEVLKKKPDDYRALHNWGLQISIQASLLVKKGELSAANALFKSAMQKFEEAIELNKKNFQAYYLWGNVLLEASSAQQDPAMCHDMLVTACSKYAESHRISPSSFQLLYNWGLALLYLAKDDSHSESLLLEACTKFSEALKLKANDSKVLKNYGVALARLARLKQGREAEQWFSKAYDMFQLCAKLKSTDYETYCTIGLDVSKSFS